MNPSAEMLAYVKRNLCLNDIEIIYLENIHEQCKTQRAKILKRLQELRNINVDLTNAQNPAVITRRETLAATAAAVVLESICKVNKQPISSTRTRQVNSTSTRPPSPPDPIHQYRSKYP
ncbi:unnamed protein product [Rotaria magnacalcarata]|uniref:Uncharacterized protein n=1 Tax=Rotaria magnacalcarata TaxID=392030 RepID=A0A816TVE3_9BILA|nr:unnamed protein product [Rotaria magnacalcarata]CAF2101266.1 unnamed protein product [Rotaria magnacalcarata]